MTSTTMFIFPSPEEFLTWLGDKKDETFDITATGCPLACFLSDMAGGNVSVCTYQYQDKSGVWKDMPAWAHRFIHEFDANLMYSAKDAIAIVRGLI